MCFTVGHVNRTEVNVLMLPAVAESPKNESRYAEDDQKYADDGRCSQTFAPLLPALRCTTERQRREAQTYLRLWYRMARSWARQILQQLAAYPNRDPTNIQWLAVDPSSF